MFVDLVNNEDVLKAVQMRGPIIPMEIRKFLGKGDSITIGAALSTLMSKNLIKCTHVKIGGSPFYYVNGQENRLELLNKYLNEKDKRTFEELRHSKVLRDNIQEPLMRVSLRNIPDFAKKIEMSKNGEAVLFWRWYLTSEDEAISIIRGESQKRELQEQPVLETVNENKPSESEDDSPIEPVASREFNHEVQEPKPKPLEVEGEPKPKKVDQIEKKEKLIPAKPKVKEEQKTIDVEEVTDFEDDFFEEIKEFFKKNGIKIKTASLVRKNAEFDLIILMKTPFGETEYFCKAKSKKKNNEGDLSTAYLQGQNKRLPTVFLTTGEITKKAKEKLREDYKGMMVKEI